jgi:hypothetical protein
VEEENTIESTLLMDRSTSIMVSEQSGDGERGDGHHGCFANLAVNIRESRKKRNLAHL